MIYRPLIAGLALALNFVTNAANGDDIKILCAIGMREIVSELQPRPAQIVEHQVSVSFGEAGDLRKRIQGGEISDVAVLPRVVLDQVVADGNIVSGTGASIGTMERPIFWAVSCALLRTEE
jgi:ABC-type molybdate transport system substrate-binding protein